MTTDDFTSAARESAEQYRGPRIRVGTVTDREVQAHLDGWHAARLHMLKAPLIEDGDLEVVNDWLVLRGAHEAEYPAGPEYGPYPYSDADPIVELSKVAGYPPVPTIAEMDAMVEAAAEAAFLSTGPSIANGMTDDWANADEFQRERWRTRARAALTAAYATR